MAPKVRVIKRSIRYTENIHPLHSAYSDDGYRMFGELSDVVHGEFDEEEGLKKYQTLKRLVVGVLDNIKNCADFAEARVKLGWNEEEV